MHGNDASQESVQSAELESTSDGNVLDSGLAIVLRRTGGPSRAADGRNVLEVQSRGQLMFTVGHCFLHAVLFSSDHPRPEER